LPYPPAEVCQAAVTGRGYDQSLAGLKVLVVDDGETNRKLLRLMLARAGAEVETAQNGQAAVARVESRPFGAVLMDMQMPVMDGYTATRAIRSRGITVPIVALTAHAMAGEEQRCRTAGCDAYLAKPVDRDDLIRTLLTFRQASAGAGRPAACERPRDLAPLRSSLDMSDAELRSIVDEFAATAGRQVEELAAHCHRGEWSAAQELAHTLKGTAAMTGFAELSRVAAQLERAAASREASGVPPLLEALGSLVERLPVGERSDRREGLAAVP
jgi:CheY-like chemotaxis protein